MATWTACIVETRGRLDFWKLASAHGVARLDPGVPIPAFALLECDGFERPMTLARDLSRALGASALGFLAQTVSDAYYVHAFVSGTCVRRLEYSRDDGDWLTVEGTPQPWEAAFFFGPDDEVDEELSPEDAARFEAARRAGDPTPIIELVRLSSTQPLMRVCEHFGIEPDAPVGRWTKPSLWSRLLGRRG